MRKRLPEIFLDELNEDYSDKSVLEALQKCDSILRKELSELDNSLELTSQVMHFFKDKGDTLVYNDNAQELFDLWDVFAEFHDIFQRLDYDPDLIILRTMLELEYLNTQLEVDYLRKKVSKEFRRTIQDLTEFIMALEDKKDMIVSELGADGKWDVRQYPLGKYAPDKEYEQTITEHALFKVAGKIVFIEVMFESGENVTMGMQENGWRFVKKIDDLD